MSDQDKIQFRRVGEEWTAYYLNGELQGVGDHYHADEWLAEHYGVEIVYDDAKDCMVDDRHAYRTLAEVEQVTAARLDREAKAAALREQADELIRRAAELGNAS